MLIKISNDDRLGEQVLSNSFVQEEPINPAARRERGKRWHDRINQTSNADKGSCGEEKDHPRRVDPRKKKGRER